MPKWIWLLLGGGIFLWLHRRAALAYRGNWNFTSPIPGGTATQGWWEPRPYRNGVHEGIDIPSPIGTPVFSVGEGIVTVAHSQADSNAGKFIVIEHADGLQSRYLHLDRLGVSKGDMLKKGQQIGLSGNTANPVFSSAAPHLHFDFRIREEFLHLYQAKFGRPSTGWGSKRGGTVGVPTEPLISMRYTLRIIERAQEFGFPVRSGT